MYWNEMSVNIPEEVMVGQGARFHARDNKAVAEDNSSFI